MSDNGNDIYRDWGRTNYSVPAAVTATAAQGQQIHAKINKQPYEAFQFSETDDTIRHEAVLVQLSGGIIDPVYYSHVTGSPLVSSQSMFIETVSRVIVIQGQNITVDVLKAFANRRVNFIEPFDLYRFHEPEADAPILHKITIMPLSQWKTQMPKLMA